MTGVGRVPYDGERDVCNNARINERMIQILNTQVRTIPNESTTRTIHVVVQGDLHREAILYVRGTAMRR
jgi:hypothetical protein